MFDFQNGDVTRQRSTEVNKHLTCCEFCAAEVDFYARYPQDERWSDYLESGEIPGPLLQLAEALLKNRSGDSSSLNSLLKEKDGLVLDKA
ncbi:MAG: hypothetical protein ABR530_05315 [Pyrinomonadaceae bacterium]